MENVEKSDKKLFFLFIDIISWVIGIIGVFVADIRTRDFFTPMRENIGFELISYSFPETGSNLAEDYVSKLFTYWYGHIIAVAFIATSLMLLVRLVKYFIIKRDERLKLLVMIISVAVAVYCACCTFPIPIGLSPDTLENYVFAKAWLPTYWHGFLTDAIYCAELLIIPHPISLILFPALISYSIAGVCFYRAVVKKFKYGLLAGVVWSLSFLFFTPTLETMFFSGRNFMYGSAVFAVVFLLFCDWLEQRKLTYRKAIWLAVFCAVTITWRGEGIIWLPILPLMIVAAYWNSKTSLKKYIFTFTTLAVFFIILWIPGKYGNEKYQGKDYYIVNTTSSLGAVFNNTEIANLDYAGADKDLSNIEKVIPIEWIRSYGDQAYQMWNAYNCRVTSQGGNNLYTGEYLKAAYNILLHNLKLWVKERIVLFEKAMNLPFDTNIQTASYEVSSEYSEEASNLLLSWNEYREKGYRDVTEDYHIEFGNKEERINLAFQKLMLMDEKYSGYCIVAVNIIILAIVVISLIKKEWLFFITGLGFLGTVAVIIFTSPSGYSNYFFYSFYNEYWIILFYGVKKTKAFRKVQDISAQRLKKQ